MRTSHAKLLFALTLSSLAACGGSESHVGKLVALVADNFETRTSTTSYVLRTTSGSVPLRFSDGDQRAQLRLGARTEIVGWREPGSNALRVDLAEQDVATRVSAQTRLDDEGGGATGGGGGPAQRRIAVILINFDDDRSQLISRSEVYDSFETHYGSTDKFFGASSRNQLRYNTTVYGYYTINKSGTSCHIDTWHWKARTKAYWDGFRKSNFDHVVVVYPGATTSCERSRGEMPGKYAWIRMMSNTTAHRFRFVVAHEIGHNLGLHHANSRGCLGNCSSVEYGDDYTTMGSNYLRLSGCNTLTLGWDTARTVYSTGTYTVYKRGSSSYPRVLRVSIGGDDLFLDYDPDAWGGYGIADAAYGAQLRRCNLGVGTKTDLLPPGGGASRPFRDGWAFYDASRGIRVTQLSHTSTSARLRIEVGLNNTPPPSGDCLKNPSGPGCPQL